MNNYFKKAKLVWHIQIEIDLKASKLQEKRFRSIIEFIIKVNIERKKKYMKYLLNCNYTGKQLKRFFFCFFLLILIFRLNLFN